MVKTRSCICPEANNLFKDENEEAEMQSSNLYVGNLSYNVSSEDLRELFSAHGKVKDAKVIGDRGFGFVEMEEVADAEKAIEALNETEHEGRTIKVNEAKPREDRGSRGGGGGGGYQKRGYNQNRY